MLGACGERYLMMGAGGDWGQEILVGEGEGIGVMRVMWVGLLGLAVDSAVVDEGGLRGLPSWLGWRDGIEADMEK